MRTVILLWILFFSMGKGFSQDTLVSSEEPIIQFDENSEMIPMNLSEESIEKYKDDREFDYTEIESSESIWERFTRWLGEVWRQFWSWLLGDYQGNSFLNAFVEILPYIILTGIVIFLIWLFIKLNPGSRLLKSKEAPEVFFTEDEEIIKSKNIHDLIQKALSNKDYRLAVRYYYLLILKKLSESELIEYEFDKTNSDYINEITTPGINENFRKVTTLYDYIWYGSFAVTETDYSKAQSAFHHLEHQIPKNID